MDILLAVIFNINGELAMLEGFAPRHQPSLEICEQRAEFMTEHLPTVPEIPDIDRIVCGTPEEIQELIDMLNNSTAA